MKHPYLYLSAVSIVLLITSFFTIGNFVVNFGDTYYVFQSKHLYILLSLVYFLASLPPLAVKIFKIPEARWSLILQTLGSIALLVIAISGIYYTKYIAGTKSPMQQVIEGFDEESRIYTIALSCIVLFIAIQVFYAILIISALLKKNRTINQP